MKTNKIKKVVIAGGGSAGWMTAAALSKLLGKQLDIVLVESEEIGPIGVGEATIPTLQTFHKLLKINEAEFMAATQATFKLGINFENWRDVGEDYIHAFGYTGKDCWACGFQHFWRKGLDKYCSENFSYYCLEAAAAKQNKFTPLANNGLNYAYHLDAILYAKFLRGFSENLGVTRIEGKITKVNLDDAGYIDALKLESGKVIEGDLFIDCTGQRALLIEDAMHTGYEDWGQWLACDSAVAIQTKSVEEPVPYTRSIAFEYGWQWKIPLQNRMGNGLVYSSHYLSQEDAEKQLLDNIEGEHLTKPLHVKYQIGQRLKHWNKNCVAIGLASGFIEPLESTAIHLIYSGITKLLMLFPSNGISDSDILEYNKQRKFEAERIRDFIILHYVVTNRNDSELWRHCQNIEIPDTLRDKINLFKETGKMFREGDELFNDSWMQVMIGQGITPDTYHSIVDEMSDMELNTFLAQIKESIDQKVEGMLSHQEFIDKYCSSVS